MNRRRCEIPLALSLSTLLCVNPALAQSETDPQAPPPAKNSDQKRATVSKAKPMSPNMSINLVNLLVKRGALSEEEAQGLIKQAEDEAYVSRQATKDAAAKASEAAKAATAAASAAEPRGARHVTYVPEIVKQQLREQIKQEVMEKAKNENWASPGLYPEWAERIHVYGDLRGRYQGSFYPQGNDPSGTPNFNQINTGSPYDNSPVSSNPYYYPTYNSDQNRQQYLLRARLGLAADLTNGFAAGFRFATGQSNSPVSTNQTLGATGGNFSKYSLWLDRAFLSYKPFDDATFYLGRFDNPFWSPTDIVWSKELGFDGAAVQVKHDVGDDFTPFAVLGAFPIYNTDLNAGINLGVNNGQPSKFKNTDKWLFGVQVGFFREINPETAVRFGVAYYDFDNVQGKYSDLCSVLNASDACNTDLTRPSFAQKGNTYRTLRNIESTASNTYGTTSQFQYFGLASEYRPLVVSAQADFTHFNPAHIILDGEYVTNTAFDRSLLRTVAVNNIGSGTSTKSGVFNGGNQGWLGRLTVGDKEIKQLWDWNVHAGYKYLESDATVDAFADADFGLGGSNLQGYFLGGNLGLSQNVAASLRWMSAKNIAGAPYAVDVVQLDVNAKF
ncbi:hypothetical protein GGD83_002795 [Rhodoblastus sphagnicola]|uniref:putative porin n=1 Tax=Rhodoblastus sphagnicola TaxID=333368 RepID=UPI001813F788|nr:hypothetical protein [Rhodoblastus sphagnicola]